MLPWAVGVGSLVVQTHLSYAYLVPALGVWGLRRLLPHQPALGRARAVGRGAGRDAARAWSRVLVVTAVVVVAVLGPTGLGGVHRPGRRQHHPPGARALEQLDGAVDRLRPRRRGSWPPCSRCRRGGCGPSFNDAFVSADGGPNAGPGGIGVASLPSLALALGGPARARGRSSRCACGTRVGAETPRARRARRHRGDRASSSASTPPAQIPRTVFGVAPHQFRWIWPLAAFIDVRGRWPPSRGRVIAELVRPPGRRARRRRCVAVTALVAVLNLPDLPRCTPARPRTRTPIPVVRDLDSPARTGSTSTGRCSTTSTACSSPSRTAPRSWPSCSGAASRSSSTSTASSASSARTGATTGPTREYRIFYRIGEDTLETPPGATPRRVPPRARRRRSTTSSTGSRSRSPTRCEPGGLKLTPFGAAPRSPTGRYAVLGRGAARRRDRGGRVQVPAVHQRVRGRGARRASRRGRRGSRATWSSSAGGTTKRSRSSSRRSASR